MSDPIAAPEEVVVSRNGPVTILVMLAATGFMFVGLAAALVGAVRNGGRFTVDDAPTGLVGSTIGWVLLTPLTLLLGVAVVALVRGLFRPERVVLSRLEYRHERSGRVMTRIAREQVTGIRFWPGQQTTWTGGPDDPGARLSRSRLRNRIEIRSARGTVEIHDGPRWPAAVETLRDWVRERPELVDDPDSVSFLRDAEPSPVAGPPERLPRSAVGLTGLAVRRRDAWAPFLADGYGQYSDRWNGRYTLPRAVHRGGPAGLAWRWVFLWLPWAPALILGVWVLQLLAT